MAGHIITIIGGKGGVGKSQVAANLAFAYATDNKKKCMLMDFDIKSAGDQNFITGMKLKAFKDVSEFSGAIDSRTIQQFVTGHSSWVYSILVYLTMLQLLN